MNIILKIVNTKYATDNRNIALENRWQANGGPFILRQITPCFDTVSCLDPVQCQSCSADANNDKQVYFLSSTCHRTITQSKRTELWRLSISASDENHANITSSGTVSLQVSARRSSPLCIYLAADHRQSARPEGTLRLLTTGAQKHKNNALQDTDLDAF